MIATQLPPDRVVHLAQTLPAAPRVLAQLNRLLLDMGAGLGDIGVLLRRDALLASRIIRVVNSPAFRGSGVSSVEQALQRVGFSEVYRLVGIATISQLAESPLTAYGYTPRLVSENALLCALAGESLARRGGAEPRFAYSAGLLRSLGKVILDRAAPEFPGPDFRESGSLSLATWEEARFGVTSTETGARVLAHLGFPDAVVAGVAGQSVDRGHAVLHPLACIVSLAVFIAQEHGRGLTGECVEGSPSRETLACARINLRDLQEISDEVYTTFVAFRTALS